MASHNAPPGSARQRATASAGDSRRNGRPAAGAPATPAWPLAEGTETAPQLSRHSRATGGEHGGQAARRTTPANRNGRRRDRNRNHPRRRNASNNGNGAHPATATGHRQAARPRAGKPSGGGGRRKARHRDHAGQRHRRGAERDAQGQPSPGRKPEARGTHHRRGRRNRRQSEHDTPHKSQKEEPANREGGRRARPAPAAHGDQQPGGEPQSRARRRSGERSDRTLDGKANRRAQNAERAGAGRQPWPTRERRERTQKPAPGVLGILFTISGITFSAPAPSLVSGPQ